MTEPSKPRLAIDLDDLERQLLRSAEQPAAKKDPLAELARIVGQDDPFRKLLGESGPAPARASQAPPQPPSLTLSPEEEGVLGREGGSYAEPAEPASFHGDDYSEPPYEPLEPVHGGYPDAHEAPPAPAAARSRKPLLIGAALVGLVAIAGIGVSFMRGGSARLASNGEPPLVKADAAPSKIAPLNPGGVEIPNQNKQIFERGAQDTQTRVVDRQEQPVDVRQAARNMPTPPPDAGPRVGGPGGQGGTNPSAAGAPRSTVTSALGEPRRVRTVAVRPDGSIDTPATGSTAGAADLPSSAPPPPPAQPSPQPSGSATPPIAAMPPPAQAPVAPTAAATPEPAPSGTQTPTPAAPPTRPRTASSSTPGAALPAPTRGDTLAIPPANAPLRPPGQVAAAPARPAAAEAPKPAAEPARTSAPEPSTGGFSVQIATRPTEAEARAAYDQLAARFSGALAGHQALIRKADVNGKTVYRVRVGPASSRAEAVDLCVRLKAAGGECFVAPN